MSKTPAPAATRAYPTMRAWLSEPSTQERLAEFLIDPVFNAFCHYISESMKVQPSDLTGSQALIPQELERKSAMHVGASQFIPKIKEHLSSCNFISPSLAGWEHIHPNNQ